MSAITAHFAALATLLSETADALPAPWSVSADNYKIDVYVKPEEIPEWSDRLSAPWGTRDHEGTPHHTIETQRDGVAVYIRAMGLIA